MSKGEERRDSYWVYLKQRTNTGLRLTIKSERFSSSGKALMTYEQWVLDNKDKQGFETIKQFCKEKKFEIHYIRSWEYDCVVTVDVGSHTELFYIVTDEKEYKRINNDKRLTQEEAIELAHGLSHTLAKVGIDVKDTDELLKSLGELIKESAKTNR